MDDLDTQGASKAQMNNPAQEGGHTKQADHGVPALLPIIVNSR
ncbi:MAG: hypothetical protein AAF903_13660 [Pseudomonadota bacterium]